MLTRFKRPEEDIGVLSGCSFPEVALPYDPRHFFSAEESPGA